MSDAVQGYIRPGYEVEPIPGFPHAPSDWTPEAAEIIAQTEGLTLTEEYWEMVRVLQALYTRSEEHSLSVRNLHDALNKHFHSAGGLKHLYVLFPKGPLAQGCLLAGLQPPAGAQDKGLGSAA
ncbi:MAG TPA: TusE/DsrC/DsvC family sulfur relay protein [Thiobacillus sp.]